MNEIWKDIKGFEGVYKISTLGRIKTVERTIYYDRNRGKNELESKIIKERIRKQKFNKHTGYMMIGLNAHGKNKSFTIHSLMGETFLDYKRGQGKKGNSNSINHKDGNKINNNLENLEVVSLANNVRHMFKTGLSTNNHKVKYNEIEYYSKSEMRRQLKISERKQRKLIESEECKVL